MIDLLATLQPVLLIGVFILMYSLENLFQYLHRPVNPKRFNQDQHHKVSYLMTSPFKK